MKNVYHVERGLNKLSDGRVNPTYRGLCSNGTETAIGLLFISKQLTIHWLQRS